MANVKLLIDIEANSAKLVSEVQKANKSLDGMKKSVEGMQKSLSLISAASIVSLGKEVFHAAEQMYGFARGVASSLNDIERQAKVLGMSTNEFQKWSYTAKMSDVSNEDFSIGMKRLTMSMSEATQKSGDGYRAFEAMGISATDASGALKPLNVIMKEIANKFAQWEDGPEKIALALTIFGKSGEKLILLLNQGADGISKYFKELEKLKGVVDPGLIEAGSKAEDAFKRISTQMEAGRLRMAPFALGFANLIESMLGKVNEFRSWVEKNPKIWGFIVGAIIPAPVNIAVGLLGAGKTKSGLEKAQDQYLLLEDFYKRTEKIKAPKIPSATPEYPEWRATLGEERAQAEKEYWEAQHKTWEIEDNLIKVEGERAQLLADDMFPSMDKVTKIQEQLTEGAEKLRIKLVEVQILVSDFGWEDYALGVMDASSAGERAVNQLAIANEKSAEKFRKDMEESDAIIKTFADGLSSAWSTNMTSMLKGTQSFGEAVKNIFMNVADSVVSSITKMATNWALFGSMSGKEKEGGGYGGLIGLIGSIFAEGGILPGHFTPIRQFAGGGIADRPTLGMVGEGGGAEAVVPLRGGSIPVEMSGEGKTVITNIMYVEATDVDSFERKYGSSVNKIFKTSARKGGAARRAMRSYI